MSLAPITGPYRRFKKARACGDVEEMTKAAMIILDAVAKNGHRAANQDEILVAAFTGQPPPNIEITVPPEVLNWAAWQWYVERPRKQGEDTRTKRQRQLDVVRYVLACRGKVIEDRTPFKTIEDTLSLDKDTVKKWVKRYGHMIDTTSLADLGADAIRDLMETVDSRDL
jgi:hypothetical protein